jgi:hypothetical protein
MNDLDLALQRGGRETVKPLAEPVDRAGQTVLDLAHHLAVNVVPGDLLAVQAERRGLDRDFLRRLVHVLLGFLYDLGRRFGLPLPCLQFRPRLCSGAFVPNCYLPANFLLIAFARADATITADLSSR